MSPGRLTPLPGDRHLDAAISPASLLEHSASSPCACLPGDYVPLPAPSAWGLRVLSQRRGTRPGAAERAADDLLVMEQGELHSLCSVWIDVAGLCGSRVVKQNLCFIEK